METTIRNPRRPADGIGYRAVQNRAGRDAPPGLNQLAGEMFVDQLAAENADERARLRAENRIMLVILFFAWLAIMVGWYVCG